jgi:hypothetical protein
MRANATPVPSDDGVGEAVRGPFPPFVGVVPASAAVSGRAPFALSVSRAAHPSGVTGS